MDIKKVKKEIKKDKYLIKRSLSSEGVKRILLSQTGFSCPICGKTFITKNPKKVDESKFEVAHIFPNSPSPSVYESICFLERLGKNSESIDNLIALCHDCHHAYDHRMTKEEYLKMVRIKKSLILRSSVEQVASQMQLNDNITDVIDNISIVDEKQLVNLSYTPVRLDKKFASSEFRLKIKIKSYVNDYYLFIRSIFKRKETSNFHFETLASQFKACFIEISSKTSNKMLIFDSLVNWVKKISKSSDTVACEAIVSFFVQNCEVFNEITK